MPSVRRSTTSGAHEALALKFPAGVYTPSTRLYRGLPGIRYPQHTMAARLSSPAVAASACTARRSISQTFCRPDCRHQGGRTRRLARLLHELWGYIGLEQKSLGPLDNPFGPRL